ncbi:lytic transglycosylase domain-containing protein [Desulfomarina sp.]
MFFSRSHTKRDNARQTKQHDWTEWFRLINGKEKKTRLRLKELPRCGFSNKPAWPDSMAQPQKTNKILNCGGITFDCGFSDKCFSIKHFIISVLILLGMINTSWADLDQSLKKFKNKKIEQNEIEKLARFDHLIRYFADFSYFVPKHKVNPNFIRALILAESGANPRAVSNRKAIGLGQILYSTGKEAAKELSESRTHFRHVSKTTLKNLKKRDLFDPAVNILLTCYLIAKYNYKFNGRLDLVVSAWNAGENTESLARGKHAPFRETEDLIGKINNYFIYLLRQRPFP